MVRYTKEDFENYRLKRIAEIEQELIVLHECKSTYSHKQAQEIVSQIPDNDFARTLAHTPPSALTPKQRLWLHILAVREKPPASTPVEPKQPKEQKRGKILEYRMKYTYNDIIKCAEVNGYHTRRTYINGSDSAQCYEVARDEEFTETRKFFNTTEAIKFMTGNLLEGDNIQFALKNKPVRKNG